MRIIDKTLSHQTYLAAVLVDTGAVPWGHVVFLCAQIRCRRRVMLCLCLARQYNIARDGDARLPDLDICHGINNWRATSLVGCYSDLQCAGVQ